MLESSASEESCQRLRKKRPERQLYIPPAQRTQRRLSKENSLQDDQSDDSAKTKILYKKKNGAEIDINKRNIIKELEANKNKENDIKVKYKRETGGLLDQKCTKFTETEQDINYISISWEYRISRNDSDVQCQHFCEPASYPYFNYSHYSSIYKRVPIFCNKSSSNILYILYKDYALWQPKVYINYIETDTSSANSRTYPLYSFDEALRVSSICYNMETVHKNVLASFDCLGFRAFKMFWNGSRYFNKSDVIDLSIVNCGHKFIIHTKDGSEYLYECEEDHGILKCYLDQNKKNCCEEKPDNCTFENGVRQNATKSMRSDIIKRTRPIMKYVDNGSDTLQIGKNYNVNDWEDLFNDDDDQLEEEIFKEIVHEVGTDLSNDDSKGEYSEYFSKQSEDLDHMVELYDFPPSLGTHDIIQAFSHINTQRAVELSNSLIKVRPMAAASSMSLSTAYKSDLKPAMKRPQTNLQTARRLITTHLGTKSKVSREQNAKERNDLQAARELKKLARKNEQDAWEGKLRSSVN
ncbi:hypothetical protein NQ314_007902 [Rhamnusium bicolor]|uniref:Uncharacterized protein n=1 Tax=Rhamnusium bicolor TaxID=1586634 RepID=A0AAV8YHJ8_9CUCU|nr:hypothetical protein NQ314_007902 [Rhamnusium bicolor]